MASKSKRSSRSSRKSRPRSSTQANDPRASLPQSDPQRKPFLPEDLDRTVIAIPLLKLLLDERLALKSDPGLKPIAHKVIIDLNVSVEGGDPTQLTQETAHRPVVSADGKTIECFMPDDAPGPAKLALLDFASGRLVKEFKSKVQHSGSALRWSPDHQALTYVVRINGAGNIWSQPLAGGDPVPLTDWKSDAIYGFDWAKDGRLVCERGSVLAEVVLIREDS